MGDLKLSVILPVYNAENYLHRCIDSIVSQSYTNIEVIIVDDGSTDQSAYIIDSYTDARIRVIHKGNGGIGSAYKRAFALMSGEYITFIDSDDYWVEGAFEQLMNLVDEYDPDLLHFGLSIFDEAGNALPEGYFSSVDRVLNSRNEILAMHFEQLKHPTLVRFYKRQLFDNIVVFEQNIGIDEMLTPQLLTRCQRAVYSSRSFYNVTLRNDSVCRSNYNQAKVIDSILVNQFVCNFMQVHISQYIEYPRLKYLNTLLLFYRLFLKGELDLPSDEVIHQIRVDMKELYAATRKTELYRKQPFAVRRSMFLMLFFSWVYRMFYCR